MGSFILRISLLFFLFHQIGECSENKPPLHVVTVANYLNIGLERLLFTAELHDHKVQILGMNKSYPNHFVKLYNMQKFLKTIADNDLVMFVDAFDVIILGSEEVIVDKFLEFNRPCVFSAERNYHPKASVLDLIGEYPKPPATLRFLNSGSYIGYAYYLKNMIDETIANRFFMPIKRIPKRLHDDQYHFHRYFVKHDDEVVLDHFAKIFLPLTRVEEDEIELGNSPPSICFFETNTKPLVIHGNGCGLPLLISIFDRLFPQIFPTKEDRL